MTRKQRLAALFRDFKAIRAEHPRMGAKDAFRIASHRRKKRPFDVTKDSHYNPHAQWTAGKFRFVASAESDDDGWSLCDYLGQFSKDPGVDAISHRRRHGHSNELEWFNPANTMRAHYPDLRHDGMSKHEAWATARSYLLRDYERAASYGRDWSMLTLTVEVFLKDDEDDTALGSASCSGIESDSDDYFAEVFEYLAADALDEAKKRLGRICELAAA
jgi:hypothetical protein